MTYYGMIVAIGVDFMRTITMLSAYQESHPNDAVEYLPPMAYSNTVEWKGLYGTVESEVGITDPSYAVREKQRIIRRMRRFCIEDDFNHQKLSSNIEVAVRIYTDVDLSKEIIRFLPTQFDSDNACWYTSLEFTYDARHPKNEYELNAIVGSYGGGLASPINAEIYAKVKTIAIDMCNPNKPYDINILIDLIMALNDSYINEIFLTGWGYLMVNQKGEEKAKKLTKEN